MFFTNSVNLEKNSRKLYQVLAKDILIEDMIGTKKKLVHPTDDCTKKSIKFWPKYLYISKIFKSVQEWVVRTWCSGLDMDTFHQK